MIFAYLHLAVGLLARAMALFPAVDVYSCHVPSTMSLSSTFGESHLGNSYEHVSL